MRTIFKTLCLLSLSFMLQSAWAADPEAGEAKFKQLCATCHGDAGKGDGPAAAGLDPKPRDMSDTEWQESVDDEHLRTVITEGEPAVGLSSTMTAFGHALDDDDLDNVIAYIRSLDD
ncbi:MAG: c-type cytochrome [Wenzhouxiangella sp.]